MKAVLCPVCGGKGVVYGVAESGAYPTTTCHGCNGKGWVEVEEDKTGYTPYPWYPWNLIYAPWYYDPGPTCGF